ncbi:SDR family NAD(P)-dependent oxidoreductase [Acidisoma silvae]|uniref:SDR family oxidoreductase n=1 Tax=Acidisoma silvae TaxID=2802396 RepID=A0A963YVM2_9PROT|nr:SDR family NAD(P)-dependent oxidoreductase [Acidisoma silvae]MCB8878047.1 SDR family oxidoreductase [Acidisoma silvae]
MTKKVRFTMYNYPIERTAIVTGAASARGIGRDLARRLLKAGWHVGAVDLDATDTSDITIDIDDAALRLSTARADISKEEDVEEAARHFERNLPPVLAVVNVAGISDPTPFLQTSLDRWERVLRVNLTGTFLMTRRFVPGMIERGVGRIVSLSSTAAQSGGGTYSAAAYGASKAGIEGMTRALAIEIASTGVTANAIAPAIIDTDIMGGRIDEERLPYFTSRLPVGRLGRVDEVSALIEFLIGPDAGYITGATYNINGGARIG